MLDGCGRSSVPAVVDLLTAGVVAGSEKDPTGSLALADEVASCGSGKNTVLADQELLYAIRGTNLGDQLDNFRIPVSPIAPNDEEGV